MKKAIFIVGPTAVGKTDLAFYLSFKISSVLISADSIQVYRGADIISGKDNSIQTELLDVVNPTEPFSVNNFVDLVKPIVKKATSEQKIPIIVGGTGFYINALFGKIDTIGVPPDEKLRNELSTLSVSKLQEKLKYINSERFENMNNSDKNNPRRLIRAIEVNNYNQLINYNGPVLEEEEVLIIGLEASMDNLKKRIEDRVKKRIDAGALKEVEVLFRDYKNLSPQLRDANGYRELFDYLLGLIDFETAKQKWIDADYHHAKNQMTWFRKRKNINWFDPVRSSSEKIVYEEIFSLIKKFLNTSNGV